MDYLLHLALVNIVCYLGFIVFPVAGPLVFYPEKFTVPLHGGFFAWCGEWIRSNMHYPGGSLPSPHCAAWTTMLLMLYRHNRKVFYLTLPLLVTIYPATVYGRYHYLWDSLAGILVAFLVVVLCPFLVRGTSKAVEIVKQLLGNEPETGSVSE